MYVTHGDFGRLLLMLSRFCEIPWRFVPEVCPVSLGPPVKVRMI